MSVAYFKKMFVRQWALTDDSSAVCTLAQAARANEFITLGDARKERKPRAEDLAIKGDTTQEMLEMMLADRCLENVVWKK